jgi:adenylylsulfate kinase-like enzyme
VYVECSIERLAERDVKGLYKKALAGEIANFTGVSDPYEPPLNPEVVCYSDGRETAEQSAAKVIAKLESLGYIERREPVAVVEGESSYTEEEEDEVTERLRDLGYL